MGFTTPIVYAASSNRPIHKVLIVVAMNTEAAPIITKLHLKPLQHSFSNLPMRGYTGRAGKVKLLLIINGIDPVNKVQNIGTQAATLSTYLGIDYFHPDLIISIGTAGGVPESGAQLNDIFLSDKIFFFNRRIPMPGYEAYGIGGYQSATFHEVAKTLQLRSGNICSGDSFDEEAIDYKMFLKEHCSAIDMEAAGVAWVSMLTKTPMLAIKGVTNFVRGKDIHDQFIKNLKPVTIKLADNLNQILLSIS